jgi:hypothetical protein
MNPHRPNGNAQLDLNGEAEPEIETGQKVLSEIAEDARRLKNRYPKETIVPEGGE